MTDDLFHLTAPWAEQLNADTRELDAAGAFPYGKWKAIQESGLLRVPFAPEFGGAGRSLTETMRALEGLGHISRDAGLSFSASTQIVSVGTPLQRFASRELKEEHLPRIVSGEAITAHAITERSGGSDAVNLATVAHRDGDHYVVTGDKMFITNAPVADLFLLYVRTGKPGPFGLTTLLVDADTPGLTVGPALDKIGLRTSPIGTLAFDGMRVPVSRRVGAEGAGFRVLDYVMKREVLFGFSLTLGEMTRRLEETVAFAKERHQFGRPIGSYQGVSHKIADMKIRVETARKWLTDTGAKVERNEDAALDLAATKTVVSEANLQTALDAVQIHGGRGVLTEHGIERDLRNSIAGTIYSGTSEIQRNRIAMLLGL
ncbi:alkylation response protein AidB-like acyl-CoA dehydrogenase [Kitasatospora sp. SolWspMP-SS2h]|uniref:acyl-CoA dehydrogenase family protein n=1 Tax=Kitasatospora sp. SolWspMP-SS2h TaxID=1305729 RepID=UPI000DBA65F2|nr:acyl-CoA dehydrogenase family protein [Kitasatospora sp. SolWspMP-SS2h]RAJ45672.1 alkylation response protein AidB-like acyl-CoA dehydrogenase [Kitasatospora sp. SolWspMP-SS2h]